MTIQILQIWKHYKTKKFHYQYRLLCEVLIALFQAERELQPLSSVLVRCTVSGRGPKNTPFGLDLQNKICLVVTSVPYQEVGLLHSIFSKMLVHVLRIPSLLGFDYSICPRMLRNEYYGASTKTKLYFCVTSHIFGTTPKGGNGGTHLQQTTHGTDEIRVCAKCQYPHTNLNVRFPGVPTIS